MLSSTPISRAIQPTIQCLLSPSDLAGTSYSASRSRRTALLPTPPTGYSTPRPPHACQRPSGQLLRQFVPDSLLLLFSPLTTLKIQRQGQRQDTIPCLAIKGCLVAPSTACFSDYRHPSHRQSGSTARTQDSAATVRESPKRCACAHRRRQRPSTSDYASLIAPSFSTRQGRDSNQPQG